MCNIHRHLKGANAAAFGQNPWNINVNLVVKHRAILIGLGLSLSSFSFAQPLLVAPYQHADVTGIVAKTETGPSDDAILAVPPEQLSLLFPSQVRLVKLTLRNEQYDWIDIHFRYDPKLGQNYTWDLPALTSAEYYTADWAILLGRDDRLVRGSFSFAFGPGAKRPSVIKEAEALLLDQRVGDGDLSTRFVTPPRTEIIIDRDPPQYDPPFVIELEASEETDASINLTD